MSGRSFASVLWRGRHEAFFFGVLKLNRRDGKLLSLEELTRVPKPEGESWLGARQIDVAIRSLRNECGGASMRRPYRVSALP